LGKKDEHFFYGFETPIDVFPTNIHSFGKMQLFSLKIDENFRGYAFG